MPDTLRVFRFAGHGGDDGARCRYINPDSKFEWMGSVSGTAIRAFGLLRPAGETETAGWRSTKAMLFPVWGVPFAGDCFRHWYGFVGKAHCVAGDGAAGTGIQPFPQGKSRTAELQRARGFLWNRPECQVVSSMRYNH